MIGSDFKYGDTLIAECIRLLVSLCNEVQLRVNKYFSTLSKGENYFSTRRTISKIVSDYWAFNKHGDGKHNVWVHILF